MILRLLLWPFRVVLAVLASIPRIGRRKPEWVELDLSGGLRWRDLGSRTFLRRRRRGPTVHGIDGQLREAARSPAVKGLLVRLGELHGSAAAVDGLAAALRTFRESGRQVVVTATAIGQGELPLLAAASRVVLAPGSQVLLLGLSARVSSLRDALERAGIRAEFFRRGRFKSAPETFTEREVSPEHRALVEAVLDHHEARLLGAIAGRCGTGPAQARAVLDGGPYSPARAREVGLVDELAFPDELEKALGVPKKPRIAPLGRSLRVFRAPDSPLPRPRLAVVPISGIIKPGPSVRWPGTTMAGSESVTRDLDTARKDRRVRGVIVWIESRGGAASASELMWHAVRRCAAEKPTVAYVDGVAASGGYFAASGARRVIAAPGALVGSIGAFTGRFDARALLERLGVRQQVFLRGARAGLLEPAHELTDGDRAALDRSVGETYADFVARVAEGRRVPRERIEEVGEGRVFVAAAAPPVLVDQVGGFPDALAWVAREAGVDAARARLVRIQHAGIRPGLREVLALARAASVAQSWLLWDGLVEVTP